MNRIIRNVNGFLIGLALVALAALPMEARAQDDPREPGFSEEAEYRGFIRTRERVTCIYVGARTGIVYTLKGPGTNGPCPGSPEYIERLRERRQAPAPVRASPGEGVVA